MARRVGLWLGRHVVARHGWERPGKAWQSGLGAARTGPVGHGKAGGVRLGGAWQARMYHKTVRPPPVLGHGITGGREPA
jgi:hypothetical protein